MNQGVSLYVVQGLLGHASPRMTQRYAHLAPQTLLDAAEVVYSVVIGPNQITAVSEAAEGVGYTSRHHRCCPPGWPAGGVWPASRLDRDGHIIGGDFTVLTRDLVLDVVRSCVSGVSRIEDHLSRRL